MRTRRHFQPTLDGLPSRIAPSAVGGLLHVAVLGHVSSSPSSKPATPIRMETTMPETGTLTPVISAPTPANPPGTILC